jgi:hypothetical protein
MLLLYAEYTLPSTILKKRKVNILRTKEDLIKKGSLNKGVNRAGEETTLLY